MSHIVADKPWGVVDIDLDRGHVFVRQDWHYAHWLLDDHKKFPVRPWTSREQIGFHNEVDRLIWGFWSRRANFRVSQARPGAPARGAEMALRGRTLTSSFDVRRVHAPGHWTATVTKVDPERRPKPRAEVDSSTGQLRFYSIDVLPIHTALREDDKRKAVVALVGKIAFGSRPTNLAIPS